MDNVKNEPQKKVGDIKEPQWGEIPDDNFGYDSDEQRREKRGLEDWEMVEKMPVSQRRVPPWFFAIIAVVLLIAIGLSFPFWGERPGSERPWIDWGFGVALLYIAVFGTFVFIMVAASAPGPEDIENNDEETPPSTDSKNKK